MSTPAAKPGNDNKRLKQLLRALSARHKTLKIQYADTHAELAKAQDQQATQLAQHTKHQEEIQHLARQLDEARRQQQQQQQHERAPAAAAVDSVTTAPSTTSKEEDARTSDLSSLLEEKAAALEQANDELATARESFSKQEISTKRVNERHKSLKALVKSQKKESEMKEKKLTKQLLQKKEDLENKTKEVTKLESENKSLTGTVVSLREEMDALHLQVEKHESAESEQMVSMSRLRRVAKEREEVASRRMETITELEERLSVMVGECNDLRAQMEVEVEEEEKEEPVVTEMEAEVEEEADTLEERGVEESEEVSEEVLVGGSQHEYLKQAVVRFLVTKEISERVSLAPVIAELLRLSSEEQGRVVAAVGEEASSGMLRGVTSWFSPYSD